MRRTDPSTAIVYEIEAQYEVGRKLVKLTPSQKLSPHGENIELTRL